MHNYISPANCWYHYQRCMTSLSMRNTEHEVAFLKRDAGTVRKHNVPSDNDCAGQKRAIRTMCLAKYNSHTDPLFKINKILKVSDMYELEISHFMLKYEGNRLPDSFQKFYMTNEEPNPNRARTRQATDYIIKASKSKFTELMPSIAIPKIWNTWKNATQILLHKHLL